MDWYWIGLRFCSSAGLRCRFANVHSVWRACGCPKYMVTAICPADAGLFQSALIAANRKDEEHHRHSRVHVYFASSRTAPIDIRSSTTIVTQRRFVRRLYTFGHIRNAALHSCLLHIASGLRCVDNCRTVVSGIKRHILPSGSHCICRCFALLYAVVGAAATIVPRTLSRLFRSIDNLFAYLEVPLTWKRMS